MTKNYIPDGYIQPIFIAAVPQVHDDFRCQWRQLLIEERSKLIKAMNKMEPEEFDQKIAKEMASRITEWDLVDDKGASLPVTAKNMLRMMPKLFVRLNGVFFGEGCDLDPELDDESKSREAEEKYESALTGASVGSIREAADEKNSVKG